jgi:hypothetical protein
LNEKRKEPQLALMVEAAVFEFAIAIQLVILDVKRGK